jgi:nucleoid-associated protein YgaU
MTASAAPGAPADPTPAPEEIPKPDLSWPAPAPVAPVVPDLPSSPAALSGGSSFDNLDPPVTTPENDKKTVVKAPVQDKYKVWIYQKNGDTLWRIAEKVYGDRTKWPLIYEANKDVLQDPNKIYPKQVLKIPPVDWQP